MATITVRPRSNGTTAYRVSWREGGSRHGAQQSETFTRHKEAERFRAAVELAGQQWPPGWTPGQGYVPTPDPEPITPVPTPTLTEFGEQYVRELTNVSPSTRHRYLQQIRTLDRELAGLLGGPVQVAALREEHIRQWVNWRLGQPTGGSPKTISNYHGLLSPLLEHAMRRGLRADNPCRGHRLPTRPQTYDDQQEVVFLTEAQFTLIADCIHPMPGRSEDADGPARQRLRRTAEGPVGTLQDRRLVEVAVGTGLRWGELTALQVRDLALDVIPATLSVRRAWKRNPPPGSEYHRPGAGACYLGPPKTRRSRRTITVSPTVAAILRAQVQGKAPEEFVFTAPMGGPLQSAAWYERRWLRAVRLARQHGLAVSPGFHSLRHSHACWLVSAGVPLPVIQQRLGHESIKTTIDLYGGILPQAHAVADAAIDAALGGSSIVPGGPVDAEGAAPSSPSLDDEPPADPLSECG